MEVTLDHSGFEDFIRGKCVYKCRICDRKYFDRYINLYRVSQKFSDSKLG